MYQVGEKIVIKNNAFKGSDDPKDFEWCGKVAEVVVELGDNCYEVYVEGIGNCLLVANEMRANKARTRLPVGGFCLLKNLIAKVLRPQSAGNANRSTASCKQGE